MLTLDRNIELHFILVFTPLRYAYSSKINLVVAIKLFFDHNIAGQTINIMRHLYSSPTDDDVSTAYMTLRVCIYFTSTYIL